MGLGHGAGGRQSVPLIGGRLGPEQGPLLGAEQALDAALLGGGQRPGPEDLEETGG
jgi:hypothetical protein